MSLISIVVPVYNVEKYLKRCLDSLIHQTYADIEILLVDDGSTDRSGHVCDSFAGVDSRIKVIHIQNGGASRARNIGLEHATGDFIGFVDSDDWIAPDLYEYLYGILYSADADAAVCDYCRTRKEKQVRQKPEMLQVRRDQELMDFFYRIHGGKSFFSIWNCLYKRSVIQNIRFMEDVINEDILFTYQAYKHADCVVFSNQIKYFYFVNAHGVTQSRLSGKDYSQYKIWNKILELENGTADYEKARLNLKRADFNLYVKYLLYGHEEDISRDDIKKLKYRLKMNFGGLYNSGMLDWKRKLLLRFICCK